MSIREWSVSSGECIRVLTGHSETVLCLCMSADGQVLFSGQRVTGQENANPLSLHSYDPDFGERTSPSFRRIDNIFVKIPQHSKIGFRNFRFSPKKCNIAKCQVLVTEAFVNGQ